MRQEQIDAIGQDVFALMVGLLRPVARRQQPQASFEGADRMPLPPPQRLEMRLTQRGGRVAADLRLWVRSPVAEPVVFTWVLPLPRGAAVDALDLRPAGGGGEHGGLCERREARTWFDLARRSGLAGAILSEDAPGVFSLEVSSPGGGGLCVGLRYGYRRADVVDEAQMTLSCEAGSGPAPNRRACAGIVRLGSGERLASLVGIRRDSGCEVGERGGRPTSTASGSESRPRPAIQRSDVFAACDRSDGASAMFRGSLAGRPVRLWAEMQTPIRPAAAAIGPAASTQLDRLMAEYRRAEYGEAERRELAERVTRLGLEAGLATLWTSFVAVAGGQGPGGEMVFAAA